MNDCVKYLRSIGTTPCGVPPCGKHDCLTCHPGPVPCGGPNCGQWGCDACRPKRVKHVAFIKWDDSKGIVIEGVYSGRLIKIMLNTGPEEYTAEILLDGGWVVIHTVKMESHHAVLEQVGIIKTYLRRWFAGIST